MDAAALSQLMDMGVPRARARAALARCKGDVMTAAVGANMCLVPGVRLMEV